MAWDNSRFAAACDSPFSFAMPMIVSACLRIRHHQRARWRRVRRRELPGPPFAELAGRDHHSVFPRVEIAGEALLVSGPILAVEDYGRGVASEQASSRNGVPCLVQADAPSSHALGV
jgi:hypothetical protein